MTKKGPTAMQQEPFLNVLSVFAQYLISLQKMALKIVNFLQPLNKHAIRPGNFMAFLGHLSQDVYLTLKQIRQGQRVLKTSFNRNYINYGNFLQDLEYHAAILKVDAK